MNSKRTATDQGIHSERPDSSELDYIGAMSRETVVTAYSKWVDISRAEAMCLSNAFSPGARVLDLGCGAGRIANYLGGRCGSYKGVDASTEMIAASRRNCPDMTFEVANILDFTAEVACFDVILLMGNVLDYLSPESRRNRLLQRCASWLARGGAVVGSSHLTRYGEIRGYYEEDYHGASVKNFRMPLTDMIEEVQGSGFDVSLFICDDRVSPPDWAYWVATRRV